MIFEWPIDDNETLQLRITLVSEQMRDHQLHAQREKGEARRQFDIHAIHRTLLQGLEPIERVKS